MNGNLSSITKPLNKLGKRIVRYEALLFFMLLAMIYSFIVYRINVLSSVAPDTSSVSTASATQPHIDPTVVQKIQSLQDNSVSVQSLFDQARNNPFHE
jgi:hypothetical protein